MNLFTPVPGSSSNLDSDADIEVKVPLTLSLVRRELSGSLRGGSVNIDLDKYTIYVGNGSESAKYMAGFLVDQISYLDKEQKDLFDSFFAVDTVSCGAGRVSFNCRSLTAATCNDDDEECNPTSGRPDGANNTLSTSDMVSVECKQSGDRFFVTCMYFHQSRGPGFSPVPLLLVKSDRRTQVLEYITSAISKMRSVEPRVISVIGSSFRPREYAINANVRWDDLFLDPTKKDDLRTDVEFFINNRKLFEDNRMTYKRSYMLVGPPGNGKSMFIRLLASEYRNLSFFAVDFDAALASEHEGTLSERLTGLSNAIARSTPAVVVFEDLDRAFMYSSTSPHSISPVLQILDGVVSVSGAIFIVTANHPEKLDEAIIHRKGRFDKLVVFDRPTDEQVAGYFTEKFKGRVVLRDEFLSQLVKIFSGMSYSALAGVYEMTMMKCLSREGVFIREEDILAVVTSELDFLAYASDAAAVDTRATAFHDLVKLSGRPSTDMYKLLQHVPKRFKRVL